MILFLTQNKEETLDQILPRSVCGHFVPSPTGGSTGMAEQLRLEGISGGVCSKYLLKAKPA